VSKVPKPTSNLHKRHHGHRKAIIRMQKRELKAELDKEMHKSMRTHRVTVTLPKKGISMTSQTKRKSDLD